MNTSRLISDELYQMLTRQAAKNEKWAAYFSLVNACYEIAKNIPDTQEACEAIDVDILLVDGLEKAGRAIKNILPGGADEFYHYMPL